MAQTKQASAAPTSNQHSNGLRLGTGCAHDSNGKNNQGGDKKKRGKKTE